MVDMGSGAADTRVGTGSLRRNTVSLTGATVIGVSFIAPAAGMAFLPQVVAGSAGAAVPFEFLLALIGSLCLAYTISQFARHVANAGSFYAFNAHGLGPSFGFFSGWLLLVGYFGGFPQNMLAFGASLSTVLQTQAGAVVPWWVFTIAGTALIAAITVSGLGLSVRVDITMLGVEVVVIGVLAAVIVAHGGAAGNTLAVFTPSVAGHHSSGMLFGLVFAFTTMMGFESAATVAEETRDPRRNIPRAVIGSVLLTGGFFLFVSYAVTIGYGVAHAGALAGDPLPLDTLATRFLGHGYSVLIDFAVLFSAFAVAVAAANGLIRVIFSMARDRVLPSVLARVHPRRGTPFVAVIVVATTALGLALLLGLCWGPYPQAYSYLGAFTGIPVLLLYVLVAVSLARYVWRERRAEFRVLKHVVAPGTGAILAASAIYGSYWPLPTGAFLWIDVGFIAYAVAGIVLAAVLRRRRPELMAELGKVTA